MLSLSEPCSATPYLVMRRARRWYCYFDGLYLLVRLFSRF